VKIILTGVASCSATEFINKPLNLHSGAFTFQPELRAGS
jgi:hypothetical protein